MTKQSSPLRNGPFVSALTSCYHLYHMTKRPPPGEGGGPPPQEQKPIEKCKVDAAFWQKVLDFHKMPPEERYDAIATFSEGYEKPYGREGIKRDVWLQLFSHPEWCRAVIIQVEWALDRRIAYTHNPDHTEAWRAHWEGMRLGIEKTKKILQEVISGKLPTDDELDETTLYKLHQGVMQGVLQSLDGVLSRLGDYKFPGDHEKQKTLNLSNIEASQWLASMDDEKMREVLWRYHDLCEQDGFGDRRMTAVPFLTAEVEKWRASREESQ